jgi:hypothetical protein
MHDGSFIIDRPFADETNVRVAPPVLTRSLPKASQFAGQGVRPTYEATGLGRSEVSFSKGTVWFAIGLVGLGVLLLLASIADRGVGSPQLWIVLIGMAIGAAALYRIIRAIRHLQQQ